MKNIFVTGFILIVLGVISFYSLIWTEETESFKRPPAQEAFPSPPGPESFPESIYSRASDENLVRFILVRSFHVPVIITLNLNTHELEIARFAITNGLTVDEKITVQTTITEPELHEVIEDVYDFLRFPEEKQRGFGLDGATWVIELTFNGDYYSSSRWSPRSGSLKKLATNLFYLAEKELLLGPLY